MKRLYLVTVRAFRPAEREYAFCSSVFLVASEAEAEAEGRAKMAADAPGSVDVETVRVAPLPDDRVREAARHLGLK